MIGKPGENPLNAMAKIDVCTTDRRGLRILANTIGNLVADGIASAGRRHSFEKKVNEFVSSARNAGSTDEEINAYLDQAYSDGVGDHYRLSDGTVERIEKRPAFDLHDNGRATPLNDKGVAIDEGVDPIFSAQSVKGNKLTGEVVVFFNNNESGDVTLTKVEQDTWMQKIRGFNQKGSNGYEIDINFRLPNAIEAGARRSLYADMHAYIKRDGYFVSTNSPLDDGGSIRNSFIRVEIDASQHVINHEIGHFFGIDHSQFRGSLSYKFSNQPEAENVTRYNNLELKQIVESYRKSGVWRYVP